MDRRERMRRHIWVTGNHSKSRCRPLAPRARWHKYSLEIGLKCFVNKSWFLINLLEHLCPCNLQQYKCKHFIITVYMHHLRNNNKKLNQTEVSMHCNNILTMHYTCRSNRYPQWPVTYQQCWLTPSTNQLSGLSVTIMASSLWVSSLTPSLHFWCRPI